MGANTSRPKHLDRFDDDTITLESHQCDTLADMIHLLDQINVKFDIRFNYSLNLIFDYPEFKQDLQEIITAVFAMPLVSLSTSPQNMSKTALYLDHRQVVLNAIGIFIQKYNSNITLMQRFGHIIDFNNTLKNENNEETGQNDKISTNDKLNMTITSEYNYPIPTPTTTNLRSLQRFVNNAIVPQVSLSSTPTNSQGPIQQYNPPQELSITLSYDHKTTKLQKDVPFHVFIAALALITQVSIKLKNHDLPSLISSTYQLPPGPIRSLYLLNYHNAVRDFLPMDMGPPIAPPTDLKLSHYHLDSESPVRFNLRQSSAHLLHYTLPQIINPPCLELMSPVPFINHSSYQPDCVINLIEQYANVACFHSSSNFYPLGYTSPIACQPHHLISLQFKEHFDLTGGRNIMIPKNDSITSINTPLKFKHSQLDTKPPNNPSAPHPPKPLIATSRSFFYHPYDLAVNIHATPTRLTTYPSLFNDVIFPMGAVSGITANPSLFILNQRRINTIITCDQLGQVFFLNDSCSPSSDGRSLYATSSATDSLGGNCIFHRYNQLAPVVKLLFRVQHAALIGLIKHYRTHNAFWSIAKSSRSPFYNSIEVPSHYSYPSVLEQLKKEYSAVLSQVSTLPTSESQGTTKAISLVTPNNTFTPADFETVVKRTQGKPDLWYKEERVVKFSPNSINQQIIQDAINITNLNKAYLYNPKPIARNELSDIFNVTPQMIMNDIQKHLSRNPFWFQQLMNNLIQFQTTLNPSPDDVMAKRRRYNDFILNTILNKIDHNDPRTWYNNTFNFNYLQEKRAIESMNIGIFDPDLLLDPLKLLFFYCYSEQPGLVLTSPMAFSTNSQSPYCFYPSKVVYSGAMTWRNELNSTTLSAIREYRNSYKMMHIYNHWASSEPQVHPFETLLFTNYQRVMNGSFTNATTKYHQITSEPHQMLEYPELFVWSSLHATARPSMELFYHDMKEEQWLSDLSIVNDRMKSEIEEYSNELYPYKAKFRTYRVQRLGTGIPDTPNNDVEDVSIKDNSNTQDEKDKDVKVKEEEKEEKFDNGNLLKSNNAEQIDIEEDPNDVGSPETTCIDPYGPVKSTQHASSLLKSIDFLIPMHFFSKLKSKDKKQTPTLYNPSTPSNHKDIIAFQLQRLHFDATTYNIAYQWERMSPNAIQVLPYAGQHTFFTTLSKIFLASVSHRCSPIAANSVICLSYNQKRFELLLGYVLQIFGTSLQSPIDYLANVNYDGPFSPQKIEERKAQKRAQKALTHQNNLIANKSEAYSNPTLNKQALFTKNVNSTVVKEKLSKLSSSEANRYLSKKLTKSTIPTITPFVPNQNEFNQSIKFPLNDLFSNVQHDISFQLFPPKQYHINDFYFFNAITKRNSLFPLISILQPLNNTYIRQQLENGRTYTQLAPIHAMNPILFTPGLSNTNLTHSYLTLLEHMGLLPGYINILPNVEVNRHRSFQTPTTKPAYFNQFIQSTATPKNTSSSASIVQNDENFTQPHTRAAKRTIASIIPNLILTKRHYSESRLTMEYRARNPTLGSSVEGNVETSTVLETVESRSDYFSSEILTYSSLRSIPVLNPFRHMYDLTLLSGSINEVPREIGPMELYYHPTQDPINGFDALYPLFLNWDRDSDALLLYRSTILLANTLIGQVDRTKANELGLLHKKLMNIMKKVPSFASLSTSPEVVAFAHAVELPQSSPNSKYYLPMEELFPNDKKQVHFNSAQTIVDISRLSMYQRSLNSYHSNQIPLEYRPSRDECWKAVNVNCPGYVAAVPSGKAPYEAPWTTTPFLSRQPSLSIFPLQLTRAESKLRVLRPTQVEVLDQLGNPLEQAANPLTVFTLSTLLQTHWKFWIELLSKGYFWGMLYQHTTNDNAVQHEPFYQWSSFQFYFKMYQLINGVAHATNSILPSLATSNNEEDNSKPNQRNNKSQGDLAPFSYDMTPAKVLIDTSEVRRSSAPLNRMSIPLHHDVDKLQFSSHIVKDWNSLIPREPYSPSFSNDSRVLAQNALGKKRFDVISQLPSLSNTLRSNIQLTTKKSIQSTIRSGFNRGMNGVRRLDDIFTPNSTLTLPFSEINPIHLQKLPSHLTYSLYQTEPDTDCITWRREAQRERNRNRRLYQKSVKEYINVVTELNKEPDTIKKITEKIIGQTVPLKPDEMLKKQHVPQGPSELFDLDYLDRRNTELELGLKLSQTQREHSIPEQEVNIHYKLTPPQTIPHQILNSLTVFSSFLPPLLTPFSKTLVTTLYTISINALDRCRFIKGHLDAAIALDVESPTARNNSLPTSAPLTILEYNCLWLCFGPVVYNTETFNHFFHDQEIRLQYEAVTLLYSTEQWYFFIDEQLASTNYFNPLFLQLLLFTYLIYSQRLMEYMKQGYILSLDQLLERTYYDFLPCEQFHGDLIENGISYTAILDLCCARKQLLFSMFEKSKKLEYQSGKENITSPPFTIPAFNINLLDVFNKIPNHADDVHDYFTLSPFKQGGFNIDHILSFYSSQYPIIDDINGKYYNITDIQSLKPIVEYEGDNMTNGLLTPIFHSIPNTMFEIDQNITTPEYSTLDNLQYDKPLLDSMDGVYFSQVDKVLHLPPMYSLPTKEDLPAPESKLSPLKLKFGLIHGKNHPNRMKQVELTKISEDVIAQQIAASRAMRKKHNPAHYTERKDKNVTEMTDGKTLLDDEEEETSDDDVSDEDQDQNENIDNYLEPIHYTGLLYFCIDALSQPSIDDIITIINGLEIQAQSPVPPHHHSPPPVFMTRMQRLDQMGENHTVYGETVLTSTLKNKKNKISQTLHPQNDKAPAQSQTFIPPTITTVTLLYPSEMISVPWVAPLYPKELYSDYCVVIPDENGNVDENITNPSTQTPISMLIATITRAIIRHCNENILITLLNVIRSRGELFTLFNYNLFLRKKYRQQTHILSPMAHIYEFQPKWFSTTLSMWELLSAAGYSLPHESNNQQSSQDNFSQLLLTLYNERYEH